MHTPKPPFPPTHPTHPQEIRKVKGKSSGAFQLELGYSASEEVIFRGNTALLDAAREEAARSGAASEAEEEEWAPGSVREGLATSLSESLQSGLRIRAEGEAASGGGAAAAGTAAAAGQRSLAGV
jgi:hypothetical protein